jgi:hypothetical protein
MWPGPNNLAAENLRSLDKLKMSGFGVSDRIVGGKSVA